MKIRKIVLLTMVLTLVCGTAVFADSISNKLRVVIDKKEYDDAGLLVDNKAYLGVRTFANAMQAMVSWDEDAKKVTIYKPNVHMFTMKDKVPFQSVLKGRYKFFVYAQIDSLNTDITQFKVTITDPYGDEYLIEDRNTSDKDFPTDMEDFGITTKEISYDFKNAGRYVVHFWMKQKGESALQVVAEKVIISK